MTYSDLSLWHETCGPLDLRSPLPGPADVDVAIVGGGLTGLWTAYYLALRDPSLRVAVVEKDVVGFGASGRNGGWLSALFPASSPKLARLEGSSREAALRLGQAMRASIHEVEEVVESESIRCDFHLGGNIVFARSSIQLARARAQIAEAHDWGQTEDDLRLLDAVETQQHARAPGALGATYTPHCARVHPGRLVRGLADAVERRGVTIYEQTAATLVEPGRVTTQHGTVRASYVVVATEGYSSGVRGAPNPVIPVYSLIVATEPLAVAVFDEIGLDDAPTFS
ncbi:MAG: FAD-binding oxidoreductase, partial [Actinomycetota bacterium]|nr:FAD-binding oxidoreductase [Actinomycetota bacterium]